MQNVNYDFELDDVKLSCDAVPTILLYSYCLIMILLVSDFWIIFKI